MANRQRGFTLIEILVVVSILAVLMGLVVVLVGKAPEQERIMRTQTAVSKLKLAIDSYQGEFQRLPPMTVKELAGSAAAYKGLTSDVDNVNECIETLVAALRHPDLSTPLGDDVEFGNTDEDSFNMVLPNTNSAEAMEIVDAWGNPIVYIHKNAYGTPVRIRLATGDEVEIEAVKKPDGTYYNQSTYQLISLGKNGKQDLHETPDLSDDIVNFKLRSQ
ncbi:MAG: type II secretion system protein [Planctomycetota bacterium]